MMAMKHNDAAIRSKHFVVRATLILICAIAFTSVTEPIFSQMQSLHYQYDALNRLTVVQYPNRTIEYTYDAAGNRTSSIVTFLTYDLGVTVVGSGSVTSEPAGIDCSSSTCSAPFESGSSVMLTPLASGGWEFSGWSGACTGLDACEVSMTEAKSVTATFDLQSAFTLNVTVNGSGSVVSDPAGIDCPAVSCTADFSSGIPVSLSAAGSNGRIFRSWQGACTGSEGCALMMTADHGVTANFGLSIAGDFDGDAHADFAIWRSSTGVWYYLRSGAPGTYHAIGWGLPTDLDVSGDYDGDGTIDIAVWRPSSGVWFLLPSGSPGTYISRQWGMETDKPLPEDYDGDGKTDIAVWRPSSGMWYILPSESPDEYISLQWGVETDRPVPKDYDGDGHSDIAVWRPDSGVWYILPSGSAGAYVSTQWGSASDMPVPGDYNGDGKADIAVWRPDSGVWYILPSGNPGNYLSTSWGMLGDVPVPGDYDGDSKTDIAVWRQSNGVWYILPSGSPGTYTSTQWGQTGDTPVSAVTGIRP
jgi:YD repeat-containing protein